MGPIGVRSHLIPFMPGQPTLDDHKVGPVSAANFGSAGILVISWAYILMMGADGLTKASKMAILNANYIATRLSDSFPLLYRCANGRVAHECILDPRALTNRVGITVEDIAKRLIDYGFHAPTISFPVAGTLMIEPTESESKAELDRFCNAMISIRQEIEQVAIGAMDAVNNPLKNAPHTVADLVDEEWKHTYSRSDACFPAGTSKQDKYWSPVNRIDNIQGDRAPICALCS
jgi:glycine dehydrogenase